MDASIIWENPGLTLLGVLAGIFLILLLPIVSAIKRSSEERRENSLRVREPSIYGDRYDDRNFDDRPSYGSYFASQGEEHSSDRWSAPDDRDDDAPASIFGSGARQRKTVRVSAPRRIIWFVVGVCVGAGGLAVWWDLPKVEPLTTVMAFFNRPAPPAVAERPAPVPAPVETKGQDRVSAPQTDTPGAPAVVGDGDGVEELIGSFVTNLKAQLPMAVGPGITMANVDFRGKMVALGFTIAQTVAPEDAPKLQKELESRFQTSVCATPPGPSNIHGLNERGASFIITYVDLLGKTVANLTVHPKFCSKPA